MTSTISTAEKVDPVPGGIPDAHGEGGGGHGHGHAKSSFLALTLGSIGVVYGDIGTSPLYAFREAIRDSAKNDVGILHDNVIGVLSLILWALTIVVTVKYVTVVMRADNNGEGGTLSLMALANRALGKASPWVLLGGIAGAALFYGDAMITPAMSVLSAVEGLQLISPSLDEYVVPLALVILLGVFTIQHRGTGAVATFFGPITLVWFLTMAIGGVRHIADDPGIFWALNPLYGVSYLVNHGVQGLVVLGAVFLAVTGVEALFIDMGHFGKTPIRVAWLFVVFPALMLNYMGQAALTLSALDDPLQLATVRENPFFLLYPDWALPFIVGLATVATVIACQATVSGAFSLTHQAIQLRLLPRIGIRHTSETQAGQIYVPGVNYMLMVCVFTLVLIFGSSERLATAYGIAVTGTMVVTGSMAFVVIWKRWKWPLWLTALLMVPLLTIDLTFLSANLLKVMDGGYLPLGIAAALMVLMWTWRRGTSLLLDKARHSEVQLSFLLDNMSRKPVPAVPGTAIFLTSDPDTAPTALLHSLKHYKVLHEKNVILTIVTSNEPRVPDTERLKIAPLTDNFTKVTMTFGYMEQPDVPRALQLGRKMGWKFDVMATSFFLSRRTLRVSPNSGMPLWQDKLFIAMANNASDATQYFRIPTGRVVEIGAQVAV